MAADGAREERRVSRRRQAERSRVGEKTERVAVHAISAKDFVRISYSFA
jgi:hypothetical protein